MIWRWIRNARTWLYISYDIPFINFVNSISFNARQKTAKEPELTSSIGMEFQQSIARFEKRIKKLTVAVNLFPKFIFRGINTNQIVDDVEVPFKIAF